MWFVIFVRQRSDWRTNDIMEVKLCVTFLIAAVGSIDYVLPAGCSTVKSINLSIYKCQYVNQLE
jgi:hypothetical protein